MNQTADVEAPADSGEEEHGLQITRLAELPEKAIVDEAKLAEICSVTTRTIRNMVARGELPPPMPFGGRATWIVGRILTWIDERAQKIEREAKR